MLKAMTFLFAVATTPALAQQSDPLHTGWFYLHGTDGPTELRFRKFLLLPNQTLKNVVVFYCPKTKPLSVTYDLSYRVDGAELLRAVTQNRAAFAFTYDDKLSVSPMVEANEETIWFDRAKGKERSFDEAFTRAEFSFHIRSERFDVRLALDESVNDQTELRLRQWAQMRIEYLTAVEVIMKCSSFRRR